MRLLMFSHRLDSKSAASSCRIRSFKRSYKPFHPLSTFIIQFFESQYIKCKTGFLAPSTAILNVEVERLPDLKLLRRQAIGLFLGKNVTAIAIAKPIRLSIPKGNINRTPAVSS